jgi:hypothetical protein
VSLKIAALAAAITCDGLLSALREFAAIQGTFFFSLSLLFSLSPSLFLLPSLPSSGFSPLCREVSPYFFKTETPLRTAALLHYSKQELFRDNGDLPLKFSLRLTYDLS